MRSIKRGRGPSFMGGIMGIFVALFGVVWTIVAISAGGGVFALFGVFFVAIAVIQVVYNFKNATSNNRYSEYDITDEGEESDPFNERFGERHDGVGEKKNAAKGGKKYCPWCGGEVNEEHRFCSNCGRKLE